MRFLAFTINFNQIIGLLFTLLYAYQVIYLAVGLLRGHRQDTHIPARLRRYAVLISARNEEGVIGELIESLKKQNYPADLLDIYVVADNCTDGTADAAQRAGATVFRRFNRVEVGKGYALDFLLKALAADGRDQLYEGYFIFDADNIVDPNFVAEMNRTFDQGGYAAITCYRNSKNFAHNWITAGYSIWFLREARFVNAARQALGQELRYIYVTEHKHGDGRWHHHVLINATGDDFDLVRKLWAQGGVEFKPLRIDKDKNFETLARYMCKEQRDKVGLRLWSGSRNLNKPERECWRVPDDTPLAPPSSSPLVLEDTGDVVTAYGHYRYVKYLAAGWQLTPRPRAKRKRGRRRVRP